MSSKHAEEVQVSINAAVKRRSRGSTLSFLISTMVLLASFALIGGIVWLYTAGDEALKVIFPEPTGPLPTTVNWENYRFGALADQTLTCEQQMDHIIGDNACDRVKTIRGPEIVCDLNPPLGMLSFGCGTSPTPLEARRMLSVTPEKKNIAGFITIFERQLGTCEPSAVGPVVGETPRWRRDRGAAGCFWVGGMRAFAPEQPRYPSGLYFDYPVNVPFAAPERWRGDSSAAPLVDPLPAKLLIDTRLLSPEENSKIDAKLEVIFSRVDYLRPSVPDLVALHKQRKKDAASVEDSGSKASEASEAKAGSEEIPQAP